jgi:hypothetical protein
MIIVHTYSQLYFLDGFCNVIIITAYSVSQSQSTLGDCATRQDMKLCYKHKRGDCFFQVMEWIF